MILKEYVDNLNELLVEHPEYADLQVIYSIDDRGSYHEPVVNVTPEIGVYDADECFNYYDPTLPLEERVVVYESDCNAICIN